MLAPFLIMFREGVEAALIVGIIAAYLRRTGRGPLLKPMWFGVAAAAGICTAIGLALQLTKSEFPQQQQELFAGVISFVAVGVLTWMVFWMRRASQSIKKELHDKVDAAAGSTSSTWNFALVGMAFFAVAREGLESVVFLVATFQQDLGAQAPVGAGLGLLVALAVGAGLYFGAVHLNLARFFLWTGGFVIVVAAGLFAGGFRALHEAGIWNVLPGTAWDTSGLVSNTSVPGTVLRGVFGYSATPSVGEVIAYFVYLVPTMFLFLRGRAPRRDVVPGPRAAEAAAEVSAA